MFLVLAVINYNFLISNPPPPPPKKIKNKTIDAYPTRIISKCLTLSANISSGCSLITVVSLRFNTCHCTQTLTYSQYPFS